MILPVWPQQPSLLTQTGGGFIGLAMPLLLGHSLLTNLNTQLTAVHKCEHIIVYTFRLVLTISLYCSLPGREISGFSFSSSATVLAYASETLFIASQASQLIHTIPSAYSDIPSNVDVAVNTIELSTSCQTDQAFSIADIAFTAQSTQPLPG